MTYGQTVTDSSTQPLTAVIRNHRPVAGLISLLGPVLIDRHTRSEHNPYAFDPPGVVMRPRPRPKNSSQQLSHSLNQNLSKYALVAGAAGVSVLALAHPGQAEVVFTPFNQIWSCGTGPLSFDLNHDGITDFNIVNGGTAYGDQVMVSGPSANAVVGDLAGFNARAKAIRPGGEIGSRDAFESAHYRNVSAFSANVNYGLSMAGAAFKGSYEGRGAFHNKNHRFLGLKFQFSGQTHFGWIGVRRVEGYCVMAFEGFAYESVPGRPIVAGATKSQDSLPSFIGNLGLEQSNTSPTLGALAFGAPGLDIWRRNQSPDSAR